MLLQWATVRGCLVVQERLGRRVYRQINSFDSADTLVFVQKGVQKSAQVPIDRDFVRETPITQSSAIRI